MSENNDQKTRVSSAGIADSEYERIKNSDVILDDGRIRAEREFQSPEELYSTLIESVSKYLPEQDVQMIRKAYDTADRAHKDQVRRSGEPYIIHPLCVAITLADLGMDKEAISAGILHDVVEDTIMTEEDLKNEFSEDVAALVDGVTKLSKLQFNGDRLEAQSENLRKMFLAMSKDLRVILIKLADRLHNMRTLSYMKPEKQQYIALETIEIYAPIANRLGISKIKVELDDLSLKYLVPDEYEELVKQIALKKSDREQYIVDIVKDVTKHIENANIKADIDGRIKHFYSIYKKMKLQNKTIDQIYDLFAVRIIVDDVKDCYAALGIIHDMYKPMPGRFKDYIAMPKSNMYQSLHTTLFGPTGTPFEIQIRTHEMHERAEYGIAAHWKYKAGIEKSGPVDSDEEKLTWLKQMLEWNKDMTDNKEWLELIKREFSFFSDHVYCFTPQGDIKDLPVGSTVIDFAYSIHSNVGDHMVGARVNGEQKKKDYVVQTGDQVEIITSPNARPSADWLKIVHSYQAKNKILQFFKHENKDESSDGGRRALENYCKNNGIDPVPLLKPEHLLEVASTFNINSINSLYAAVYNGGIREGQVVNRLVEKFAPKVEMTDEEIMAGVNEAAENRLNQALIKGAKSKGNGVIVNGFSDMAVRFSKCCSPVPGDQIVGFVTRGRGISIHRATCQNVKQLRENDGFRLIDVYWEKTPEDSRNTSYQAELNIYANNRQGLLADVTRTVSDSGININSINSRVSKQNVATIDLSFEIISARALEEIIKKLNAIDGVVGIERT